MVLKVSVSHRKKAKTIILGLLLTATACDSIEQGGDDYLKKGADLFSKGEYAKAELEIKNAIQKNPDAADSYYYMALLNEKSRNFKAMRTNLQEALKLKPDKIDARIKLAKVHLLFNDMDQSLAEVESVFAQEPENLSAMTIKAQVLDKQNKSGEAEKLLAQVLEKNPDFVEALALKSVLLLKRQDFDKGLETVEHALSIDEGNVSLHLLKIQLHKQKNDSTAIIGDYQQLLKLQPDNDQIRYALAKAYLDNGESDQAETVLRDLVREKPDNIKAKLMLLEFLSTGSQEEALDQLQMFLADAKPAQKIELAKWALSKRHVDQAKTILNKLVNELSDANSNKHKALFMLANLSYQQKEFAKSSELVDRILQLNPNFIDAKVLRAGILLNREKYAEAEELLNNILWEKPNSDSAMILLARIYQGRGEVDKAYNKYYEAFKANPSNKQALLPLVSRALKRKHNDYAKELIQTAVMKGGPNLDLMQILAKIYMSEKDWTATEKVIKNIEAKKNGQLLGKVLSAQLLTQRQRYDDAIEIYHQILQRYPWHAASLAAMASNYEKLNNRQAMTRYLDEFIEKYPRYTAAVLLKSRLLVLDKKPEQAISLLKGYLQKKQNSASVYRELARLYLIQGDREAALRSLQEGLQEKPDDIKLLMALAAFYEQDGQHDQAVLQYEKVLLMSPSSELVKNNLASILLEQGSEASVVKAVELTAQFKQSEQPYFLDSYAWAQFKSGNVDDALNALKKVIILAPDVPVFRYHLAEIYHQQGNRSSAIMELRQALALAKKKPFGEAASAEQLLNNLLVNK